MPPFERGRGEVGEDALQVGGELPKVNEVGTFTGEIADGGKAEQGREGREQGHAERAGEGAPVPRLPIVEEIDEGQEEHGFVVEDAERKDERVGEVMVVADEPQPQAEGEKEKRRTLLELVDKGEGHDGNEGDGSGKGEAVIEPFAQVGMKDEEREKDKEPTLEHVGIDGRKVKDDAKELGNVELQKARLLVVGVGEIEEEAVVIAEGAIKPEGRGSEFFAEENEGEKEVDAAEFENGKRALPKSCCTREVRDGVRWHWYFWVMEKRVFWTFDPAMSLCYTCR